MRDPASFAAWLADQSRREWVVYAKPPFGGPGQVLKYLARYTHRVAISNSRIVDVVDGQVTFGYKDYADEHRSKTMTLSGPGEPRPRHAAGGVPATARGAIAACPTDGNAVAGAQ